MTFKTCGRCGAVERILAGGICRLDRNCLTDLYRCEDCGTVTWRDLIHHDRGNFLGQAIGKGPPVHLDEEERVLADV